MTKRDGDSRNGKGVSGGAPEYKKKKRLGGKGLSLEAFVGANGIKPIVTASQIRKQQEVYQNLKKVNKYRKTLKHLAEEGLEFRPRIPLSIHAEIPSRELSDLGRVKKRNPVHLPVEGNLTQAKQREAVGKKTRKVWKRSSTKATVPT